MLKVNEIFGPTIQGEGPSQGRKVMFLRLAFCNLSCSWCDTKYTWDWKNFSKAKEVHDMGGYEVFSQLENECGAIVISGGEPLLQQRQLLPLVTSLRKLDYWVEIETNGTIIPDVELLNLVNQINCSPKLSNSGDSKERRIKSKALMALSHSEKVFFKFVISCKKDVAEVIMYMSNYFIDPHHVYLMPLGKTREELEQTTAMTKELATKYGVKFSSRLHVELYGTKRGV